MTDERDYRGLHPKAPAHLRPVPREEEISTRRGLSANTAAKWIQAAGALMVLSALAIISYTGYELIASNSLAAGKQADLAEQFAETASALPADSAPGSQVDDGSVSPVSFSATRPGQGMPAPTDAPDLSASRDLVEHAVGITPLVMGEYGDLAGKISIPAIDVEFFVSFGTGLDVLDAGPGVWEWGVVPGAPGNATVAGHRTTHGAPFRHIDSLVPGDEIIFEIPGRPRSVFEVRGSAVVYPDNVSVTNQSDGVRLTLSTCTPVGSTAQRLIVQAELIEGEYVDFALTADDWEFVGDI